MPQEPFDTRPGPYRNKAPYRNPDVGIVPPGATDNPTKAALTSMGEGTVDQLMGMIPTTPEDLGAELMPLGGLAAKLAGLIPPQYIKPLMDRLMKQIEINPKFTDEMRFAAAHAIQRAPDDAAHLESIEGFNAGFKIMNPRTQGMYLPMDEQWRNGYAINSPEEIGKHLERRLDRGEGPGLGARMQLHSGSPFNSEGVYIPHHEMEHLKQDIGDRMVFNSPVDARRPKYNQFTYENNPYEVMANAAGLGGKDTLVNKIRPFLDKTPQAIDEMKHRGKGISSQMHLDRQRFIDVMNELLMPHKKQLVPNDGVFDINDILDLPRPPR